VLDLATHLRPGRNRVLIAVTNPPPFRERRTKRKHGFDVTPVGNVCIWKSFSLKVREENFLYIRRRLETGLESFRHANVRRDADAERHQRVLVKKAAVCAVYRQPGRILRGQEQRVSARAVSHIVADVTLFVICLVLLVWLWNRGECEG
jgi:hypothetical protein